MKKLIKTKIPIEVSARHVHLSEKDMEKLFGKKEFKFSKKLSQPGQFVTNKKVDLVKNGIKLRDVDVLGPCRKQTQIEISKTESFYLGLKPPIRLSGNLKNTPGIELRNKSKNKKIKLKKGVIIAKRHLHISEKKAKKLNLKNNQEIKISVKGKSGLIFENVIARVSNNYKLAMHIDTDESNAAGISKKAFGKLV